MDICVVGAGAMGSTFGALFARRDHNVTLFDTWRAHVNAVTANGLRLAGVSGDFVVHPRAISEPAELEPADMVLVFVGAHQTASMAELLPRLLRPSGYALTLQNGIGNVEKIAAAVGESRVVAGVTHHSAAMAGPGHALHTNVGPIWIGELDGSRSERLRRLNDVLNGAGHESIIVEDVIAHIWGKFVLNCGINPICAVTGLRPGEIARTPAVDRFQDLILDEIFAVVEAKGLQLPEASARESIKKHTGRVFDRPSMLQHVDAGKATEIDALNGALVEEAGRLGMAVPYNEALTLLVKGAEAHGERRARDPDPDYERLEAEAKARIG